MKIAAFADVHAHSWKEFSRTLQVKWDVHKGRFLEGGSTPMNSRLFNIVSALCDIKDYCYSNGITNAICAGDLFHSRATLEVAVFNAVYQVIQEFSRKGIRIVFIAGNHDQVSNSERSEHSLRVFDDFHRVVDEPGVITVEDTYGASADVVCIPFSKNKEDNLRVIQHSTDDNAILVAHLGVTGGAVGSSNFVMSDEYTLNELCVNDYAAVILGHYHKPQELADDTIYCGSPVQTNFNDEGERHGFWVIDTLPKADKLKFVPLDYPQFITLTDDSDFSKVDTNSYVRLKSKTGEATPDLEVEGLRVELEKEYTSDSDSRIDVSMSEEETLKQYVDESNHGELDPVKLIRKGLELLYLAKGGN